MDILQLKKMVIVKIFAGLILCIYVLIMQVDILKKAINKYLVFDSTDENKELLKKDEDLFNGISDKIKEVSSMSMKKIA